MNTLAGVAARDAWPQRLRFAILTRVWRAAALVEPWRPAACFHLGNLSYAHGRHSAAMDAWRRAADSGSGHRKALHNLSQALVERQRWHEAALVLRRVAETSGDAASLYQAGKCHLAAGESEAARADFEACVQIEAGHVGALEHLGRLALARRDAAAARAWLRRALLHASRPEALHFLLGAADELARDPKAAFANYAQVRSEPLQSQARQRMERLQPRLQAIEPPNAKSKE